MEKERDGEREGERGGERLTKREYVHAAGHDVNDNPFVTKVLLDGASEVREGCVPDGYGVGEAFAR
jgi:hypothetical protein